MKMRILNIGCGEDRFGTDFIDLYPSRADVLKVDVNKQKLPYPNNSFNEVYMKNLFEHLTNKLFVLKECFRVLKVNGRVVLITDSAGFFGLLGKAHSGKYKKKGEEDKHYALFTPHHIENWLKKAGFREVKARYYVKKNWKRSKRYRIFIRILSFLYKRISPNIFATGIKDAQSGI